MIDYTYKPTKLTKKARLNIWQIFNHIGILDDQAYFSAGVERLAGNTVKSLDMNKRGRPVTYKQRKYMKGLVFYSDYTLETYNTILNNAERTLQS